MKKIAWVLILSMLPLGLFAQGPISFGPKIGWNSARLTTDYKQYINDIKSGYQGGLFVSLYLKNLYLQPEAYFSVKRGALHSTVDPFNPTTTFSMEQSVKLTSVDVPLILGYRLLDLKLIRLRLWGGPVASFLINKEFTLSVNGISQTDRITRDDFRDPIWSGQVGAGLDVLMLTFDVSYGFGLGNLGSAHSLSDLGLSNMVYCSLGWRIF